MVSAEEVFQLEHKLEHVLEIETVRFHPKFPKEAFQISYFSDIFAFLKRELTIVNGFFDGADVTLENSILHIQLKNGGYQILMRYHVTEYLQQLLNRLFQLSLQVKIDGEDEVPADD